MTCPVKESKGEEGFEIYFSRGRMNVLKSVLEGKLPLSRELAEYAYQCTECANCTEVCHETHNENLVLNTSKWIDHYKVWDALRKDLVEAGFPVESQVPMNKAMVELLNPYERDNKEKLDWTKELDFKIKDANKEDAETLYFVGCTSALTPQINRVAIATAKLFNKLGIDFSIFGEHEVCCGSVGMRTGDKKSFEKWERSNWLSLMIMRRAIPKTFRGTIFKETNARGFLNDLEKRFVKNKKTETSTLLANLVSEIQGQEKRK